MDLSEIRIIDAHIHQWDPFTTPRDFSALAKLFRLLPVPVDAAKRLAPRRDREFVGDPIAYLRPYLPFDYRADAGNAPVEVVAHIEVEWSQPGPLGKAGETAWVAGLPLEAAPRLGAILAGGGPAAPGVAAPDEAPPAPETHHRRDPTKVGHHPQTRALGAPRAPGAPGG
ncbi:hypothetical protein [Nocardia abscessus]|uniref:hypothetical protein n=1 Tax=Nocardia abscessus TaxID=120957 RepID=UPI00245821B8|nr:hypothetical protein [Nocardia abscessus]